MTAHWSLEQPPAGIARWKVKPKGIATIKKGDWWVPAQATTPPPRPAGGTVSSTTRTQAINRLIPRDYVGSAGVIGNWAKEPRLDPNAYEWTQNEAGRWFARPRTELTGLDPQAQADVKSFDAQTAAQQQRITDAYNAYATQASADRDAAAKAFGQLAALSGSGYGAAPMGQASGPYGQVAAPSQSTASANLAGTLGQSASQTSAGQSALGLFNLSQLPTLARSEGLSALDAYNASQQKARADLITGYRNAAATAQSDAQKNAATLRGQNLDLLAAQIASGTSASNAALSAKTGIQKAKISANIAAANRAAQLATEAARLKNQAQIAREHDLVSRANTLDRLAAQKAKQAAAAKKKAGPTAATQASWAKQARSMWEGIPHKVQSAALAQTPEGKAFLDANPGKTFTEYASYNTAEIVRELMARGATRQQALKVVREITNDQSVGTPRALFGGFN